ncbi:MAG: Gmad2 immunoglobulin-like domain-containing protein [Dethiobacteria bacterium]
MLGIETIEQPIVASSDWIKIFSPKPDEQIEGTISLSGVACVFEGTVSYELLSEDDSVLSSGFTTATMGDWGYFEEKTPFPRILMRTGWFYSYSV